MSVRALAVLAAAMTVGVAGAHGAGGAATPFARPSIPPAPVSSLHGRIAYSAHGGDIWVMNANGTGRRRLTRSGHGIDFDPDFSPDGTRIVCRTAPGSSSAPPAAGTQEIGTASASRASS